MKLRKFQKVSSQNDSKRYDLNFTAVKILFISYFLSRALLFMRNNGKKMERNGVYLIMVSEGYGSDGRQKRKLMTWRPEEGMTKCKIKEDFNIQVAGWACDVRRVRRAVEEQLRGTEPFSKDASYKAGHAQTLTTPNIYSRAIRTADE